MWEFLVLAAQISWAFWLFFNLGAWGAYRKEAAENYFARGMRAPGAHIGAIVQAAWMYGGGTWLFFGFDAGLWAFIIGGVFLVTATHSGIVAAQSIERLQDAGR